MQFIICTMVTIAKSKQLRASLVQHHFFFLFSNQSPKSITLTFNLRDLNSCCLFERAQALVEQLEVLFLELQPAAAQEQEAAVQLLASLEHVPTSVAQFHFPSQSTLHDSSWHNSNTRH